MASLNSVPNDVLHDIILPLLEEESKDALWNLARSSRRLYLLAGHLLFKHVKIRLDKRNAPLPRAELLKVLRMPEQRSLGGKKIGDLVKTLSVLSASDVNLGGRRPGDAFSTGLVAGLSKLLRRLPNVTYLHIDSPPSILPLERPLDRAQYKALLEQLEASLINRLKFVGTRDRRSVDCKGWIRLLLQALGSKLVVLDVNADYVASLASSLRSLPFLTSLRLSRQCTMDLFRDASVQCPLLVSLTLQDISIYSGPLHLRKPWTINPNLRALTMERCNIAQARGIEMELSQSRLLYLSLHNCKRDNLFWLPHLPASLLEFTYSVKAHDLAIQDDDSPPDAINEMLRECLQDPAWCPRLRSLGVFIEEGTSREDDVDSHSELREAMAKAMTKRLSYYRNQSVNISFRF